MLLEYAWSYLIALAKWVEEEKHRHSEAKCRDEQTESPPRKVLNSLDYCQSSNSAIK